MRSLTTMMGVLAIGSLAIVGCGGGGSSTTTTTTPPAHNGNTSNAGSSSHEEIRAGFLHGCQDECAARSAAATCTHYCGCMLERMEQDGLEARVSQLNADPQAVTTDPFFQRSIATCQPDLITSSWVNGVLRSAISVSRT